VAETTTETKSLAAALVALQAKMPRITKGETAKVPTKNGPGYSYSYADLASISAQLMPVMSEVGLAFTARPTIHDGRFVLAYSLVHGPSKEREDGFYPLPDVSNPQAVGSAITYARRYCLLAVTGAAPDDEDDDGKAAKDAPMDTGRQRAPESGTRVTPEERRFATQVIAQIEKAKTTDQLNKLFQQVSAATEEGLTEATATNLTNRMKAKAKALEAAA
jgi:hypothetical protein